MHRFWAETSGAMRSIARYSIARDMLALRTVRGRFISTKIGSSPTGIASTDSKETRGAGSESTSSSIRPSEHQTSGNNPWTSSGREDVLGGTGDGKTSFDIYGDMNIPLNSIKSLLSNGFLLESGQSVITVDPSKPQVMVLLGTEAFQLDGSKIKGLDTGIVEIEPSLLGFLKVAYPRPEMLVIGLGNKSRILGPKTQKLLQQVGVRHHLSKSRSAASGFNLLSMERGQEIAAFLLTPDV